MFALSEESKERIAKLIDISRWLSPSNPLSRYGIHSSTEDTGPYLELGKLTFIFQDTLAVTLDHPLSGNIPPTLLLTTGMR
ncbi:hypothetical protein PT974_06806 [Cladobotryum mycophilum]|uniref:Uncharacterized protein n=1 Tax=Cladobotryum mycophilum TaxID=491253 RepID=A0ABR0SNK9_9HYPO